MRRLASRLSRLRPGPRPAALVGIFIDGVMPAYGMVGSMSEGPDLSVVYSGAVDEVLASADRPRELRSLDVIYDLAQETGVNRGTRVVDAGCATGERSRELIRRTGCQVDGVELLPQLIEWGTTETVAAGLADQLRFHQASILDLPFPDGHADVVLCTDVFGLVEDLPRAVA